MSNSKRPILMLMGPTASGKTALALKLAQWFPIEVISVDAAQIYKGLDIGTAKPDRQELEVCPHHLIDVREPHESYSAAEFRRDALALIEDIQGRGCLPLLVGGTMFYFHTLIHGIPNLPSGNTELRRSISDKAKRLGWPVLHQQLASKDPKRASQLAPTDGQRIQRALEIIELTGKQIEPLGTPLMELDGSVIKLALAPVNRMVLHANIRSRFEKMLENGLVSEVKAIIADERVNSELPAMKTVGYRQVSQYLAGKFSYNEMMEASLAATRQLAKRQLTWLRNQSLLTWFDSGHPLVGGSVKKYLEAHPTMTYC